MNSYTFIVAAQKGDLDIMEYLLSSGCPCIEYVSECASEKGHLKVLKWLFINDCPIDYSSVYDAACKNGHTDIVDWLKNIQSSC